MICRTDDLVGSRAGFDFSGPANNHRDIERTFVLGVFSASQMKFSSMAKSTRFFLRGSGLFGNVFRIIGSCETACLGWQVHRCLES